MLLIPLEWWTRDLAGSFLPRLASTIFLACRRRAVGCLAFRNFRGLPSDLRLLVNAPIPVLLYHRAQSQGTSSPAYFFCQASTIAACSMASDRALCRWWPDRSSFGIRLLAVTRHSGPFTRPR